MHRDDNSQEARIQAHALGRLPVHETAVLSLQAHNDAHLRAELLLASAMVRARAEDPERGLYAAFGWARLSRAIDAERAAQRRTSGWPTHFSRWQTAAAVLAAVAVWQFAAVPQLPGWRGEAGYEMAGAPAPQAFAAQVAFNPQATEPQIRAALLAADARVVGGPSALGLYELAFGDAAALETGVAQLRAQTAVVESVQAFDTAATPPPPAPRGRAVAP